MTTAFQAALPFILQWEGGYVNDRDDPGGATNKGVTQAVYDAWRRKQGKPERTVQELETPEMESIYEEGYWHPPRCDALQSPLDLVQLDTAVNMGVGRAARFLQQAAGASVDGEIGPKTLECVDRCQRQDLVKKYCDVRESYYRSLVDHNPKLGKFLKGWMNRLNALRARAHVPGYAATRGGPDFGDVQYIRRIPDIFESTELNMP